MKLVIRTSPDKRAEVGSSILLFSRTNNCCCSGFECRINAKQLITHRYKLDQILQAYDTFGSAADTKALRVIIEA